jgi:DNA-binding transcriptional MerR regulator
MPKTITFTTKDVCEALGVAKHHLRIWTDKLEPFCNAATKERSARKFTLGDLSYLAVVDYLEVHYGISINTIALLERRLYDLINAPSSSKVDDSNFVFICFHSQSCKWLESEQAVSEGLIVDTYNAHKKINDYLGLSPQQVEMQLGLAMVS